MSLATFPPPKRNHLRRTREPLASATDASSFSSSSSFQRSPGPAPENKTLLDKITSKLSGIISLVKEKMTNLLDSAEEEKHHSHTAQESLQVPNSTTLNTPSFGHNSGEVDQVPVIDAELKENLTPQRIRELDETEKISKGSKVLETQNSLSIFDRSWTSISENEENSPKDNSFQTAATSKRDSENETSLNSSHSSRGSVKLLDLINFLSKVHEVPEIIPRSQKKSDPLLQKIIRRPKAIRFVEDLTISQKSLMKSKKRDRTEFGAYMCASIQKKNKEDLLKHVLKKSKLTTTTTALVNHNTKMITVKLQKVGSNKNLLKIKKL